MKIKRLCILALFLAMAICLNIVESFIPMFVPGVKLGLANCIILIMLYQTKASEALFIMLLRIILVGILKGNIGQLPWLMSLSGGICSFTVMLIFSKIKLFSVVGVSVFGAVCHSIGQIIVAMFLLETSQFIFYLPVIAILSTLTGTLTGIICNIIINRNIVSTLINN